MIKEGVRDSNSKKKYYMRNNPIYYIYDTYVKISFRVRKKAQNP